LQLHQPERARKGEVFDAEQHVPDPQQICNTSSPGTGRLSSLDLAFCDPMFYSNYTWSVLTDLYGNDHHPILVAKPATEAVDDCKRWRLTSMLVNTAERTIPKTCGKLKMGQKP
jgi:hypothetical protein